MEDAPVFLLRINIAFYTQAWLHGAPRSINGFEIFLLDLCLVYSDRQLECGIAGSV